VRPRPLVKLLTMKASTGQNVLAIRSIASNSSISQPSPAPSAYQSADEDEYAPEASVKYFPFLSLPSELRDKIYSFVFSPAPPVLDLDPSIFTLIHRYKLLSLFLVSRRVHLEASHNFFSTRAFRVFPTHPGRYFKTKRPLLSRLPAHYRSSIVTLQLRLGPGWNNPPRGWIVNDALGLKDCTSARVLKIFVECDPSDGIFKGFRISDGFYEQFSCQLLEGILKEVTSIRMVEFDAWSSVKRSGGMIRNLEEVVEIHDKILSWGPERGWDQDEATNLLDAVLMNTARNLLRRNGAVFGSLMATPV